MLYLEVVLTIPYLARLLGQLLACELVGAVPRKLEMFFIGWTDISPFEAGSVAEHTCADSAHRQIHQLTTPPAGREG